MALSKEELKEIKDGVNKAKKKSMAFAYAKTRKDGSKDPLLLIDKTTSLVKKGIMAQGGKPFTMGKLLLQDEGEYKGVLTFVVEVGNAKQVEQGMKLGLKAAHPLLPKAAVMIDKDFFALQDKIEAEAKANKTKKSAKAAKADKVSDKDAPGPKEAAKAAEVAKKVTKTRNAAEKRLKDLRGWKNDPKADVGQMKGHIVDLKKIYKSLKKQLDAM